MNMKSNILEILGDASKEDLTTNLLAHSIEAFSTSLIFVVEAIDHIAAFCKFRGYRYSLSDTPEEYGLYFHNKEGKKILWFGIWCSRWFSLHSPLCFAIHESAGDWSREVLQKFKDQGIGKIELFENHIVRDITITGDSGLTVAQRLIREIEPILFVESDKHRFYPDLTKHS